MLENHPEGRGISGVAFRSRKPCISNDYLSDPRGTTFHGSIRSDGARAVAAFPLFSGGQPVGILLFVAAEQDTFTPGFVDLLQRLADNISFALDNFALAFEKTKADKQRDRLTRMFEALSATNEAIMRAKSRTELFELVCEAAVLGGTFTSTTIVLAGPGETFLRIAASKGKNHERVSERYALSSGAISFNIGESLRVCASISTKFTTIAVKWFRACCVIFCAIPAPKSRSMILIYLKS